MGLNALLLPSAPGAAWFCWGNQSRGGAARLWRCRQVHWWTLGTGQPGWKIACGRQTPKRYPKGGQSVQASPPGPAKQSFGQRVVQGEAPHWGNNRAGQSTRARPPAPTRHHAERQVRDKAGSGQETQGPGQRWALRQSARHRRAPRGESKSRHGAQLSSSRVPSPRPRLRVAPAPGGGRGDAARVTSIGEKGLEVPRASRVQARGPG